MYSTVFKSFFRPNDRNFELIPYTFYNTDTLRVFTFQNRIDVEYSDLTENAVIIAGKRNVWNGHGAASAEIVNVSAKQSWVMRCPQYERPMWRSVLGTMASVSGRRVVCQRPNQATRRSFVLGSTPVRFSARQMTSLTWLWRKILAALPRPNLFIY